MVGIIYNQKQGKKSLFTELEKPRSKNTQKSRYCSPADQLCCHIKLSQGLHFFFFFFCFRFFIKGRQPLIFQTTWTMRKSNEMPWFKKCFFKKTISLNISELIIWPFQMRIFRPLKDGNRKLHWLIWEQLWESFMKIKRNMHRRLYITMNKPPSACTWFSSEITSKDPVCVPK